MVYEVSRAQCGVSHLVTPAACRVCVCLCMWLSPWPSRHSQLCLGGSRSSAFPKDSLGRWLCPSPWQSRLSQWPHRGGRADLQQTRWDTQPQHWIFVSSLQISAASTVPISAGPTLHIWTLILESLLAMLLGVLISLWHQWWWIWNLDSFGDTDEYTLKSEVSMWIKMVPGTSRNKKVFHDVSDRSHSRNER